MKILGELFVDITTLNSNGTNWTFCNRETFMTCLLHIHADTTCPTFDKSIFQNPFAASDITGDLVEVLLLTWIRSGTTKADFWRKLQDQLSESTHWIQTIEKWLKILVKLTRILGKHAYGVDLESIKTESESKRSRMQSSPMKSLLATYGSNPPATTTPESPTSFKTDSLPKSSARGEFGFSMEWNSERCLFVWKNMVCVLGNVNAIAVGRILYFSSFFFLLFPFTDCFKFFIRTRIITQKRSKVLSIFGRCLPKSARTNHSTHRVCRFCLSLPHGCFKQPVCQSRL